jgi:hypothetical protein
MSHCLVVIFSDSGTTWAEHTGWKDEIDAYQELKDKLTANSKISPQWVGWSYWDAHIHDGTFIKERLKDLAKHLEMLQIHSTRNRRGLNPLKLLTRPYKVDVCPTQKGESQHGFTYARIVKS